MARTKKLEVLLGAEVKAKGWKLVRMDGEPVRQYDKLTSFRGEKCLVTGGVPPRHSGSTGRIYVEQEGGWSGEFFPSVFDCQWVETE